MSLEKNILHLLDNLENVSHIVYYNDNTNNTNEKKMIQKITQIVALKKLFCYQYFQNKYIEYRSSEYPFKSFRYYISKEEKKENENICKV